MKLLILIAALTFCSTSFAGPGHGHSHGPAAPAVTREKTQEIGKAHLIRLVKAEKLDATWTNATFEKSEKKKFGAKTEWVVTFKNDKGVKGKKLFMPIRVAVVGKPHGAELKILVPLIKKQELLNRVNTVLKRAK